MPGINPLLHIPNSWETSNPVTKSLLAAPYVNQFILGPEFVEKLSHWQLIEITESLKLSLHPNLDCTHLSDEDHKLTLIGHLLDPRQPEATNTDILRALLNSFHSRDSLLAATAHFGGRWILIATNSNESFLCHDAIGLRQAFYTDPTQTDTLWVMSQAGLAGEVLSLTPNKQALDYMDTPTFRRTSESRFPATASTFKELKHLLPNHYLDLQSATTHRYWPQAALEPLSPEVAIERLLMLMSGQIRAAAKRFDLAISLTAGIDSRLVLACAKEVTDQVSFMTVRQGKMADLHADIEIPARLLKQLGLPHEIVRATSTMTPKFSMQFKENVYLAHDHYGFDAEAILNHYHRSKVAITGSGAEIGRCSYRANLSKSDNAHLTPELLAQLEYDSTHPYLVNHFKEWLKSAGQQDHINTLDLFEWEQGSGSWLAMTQLEFDMAWRDIFTPYNCREVLITLLRVDEHYRKSPDYLLFKRAIQQAWPELLSEPINPHQAVDQPNRYKKHLKALLRKIFVSRKADT